jgi:hypothetical protein
MAKILLTQGQVALVDSGDYAHLNKWSWYVTRSKLGKSFYAERSRHISGKYAHNGIKMHREIMGCVKGDGKIVDHINHNTLDNRRVNLRLVSPSINAANRKRGCGAYFDKRRRRWVARVGFMGKTHWLGQFVTKEQALNRCEEFKIEKEIWA